MRRGFALSFTLLMLGCTQLPTGTGGSAPDGTAATGTGAYAAENSDDLQVAVSTDIAHGLASPVPSSIPFKTLVVGPGVLQPGTPANAVFAAQQDADAFFAAHPQVEPQQPPPQLQLQPQPQLRPQPLPSVDFTKDEGIMLFRGSSEDGDAARIVSVEEQPDKLVVHSVQWKQPSEPTTLPSTAPMHLIAIPRSNKPVVFAPVQRVLLNSTAPYQGTIPSVEPGEPAPPISSPLMQGPPDITAGYYPAWVAVPNPDITQASIENEFRTRSQGTISSLSVEEHTLQWIADQDSGLKVLPYVGLLPQSEAWLVKISGDLVTMPGMPGQVQQRGDNVWISATLVLSVEDGMPMVSNAKAGYSPDEPTPTPSYHP